MALLQISTNTTNSSIGIPLGENRDYLLKMALEAALFGDGRDLGLVLGGHLGNGLVEVGNYFPNVAHDRKQDNADLKLNIN